LKFLVLQKSLVDLTEDELSESKVLKDLINTGTIIITCLAIFYSLIAYKDANAFFILALIKTFYNLRYLKVEYPPLYQRVLDLEMSDFTSLTFSKDIFEQLSEVFPQASSIPVIYLKYQVGSVFIINFWDTMMTILFAAAVWGLIRIGEYFTLKHCKANAVISYFRKALQWNILLGLFITYFDGIIIFSALQFKSGNIKGKSIMSLLISIVFILAVIALWTYLWVITVKIRNETKNRASQAGIITREIKGKWENWRVIFKGIKFQKLLQAMLYPIYATRILLFYVVLSYLWEYPLAQASLFMAITIVMLIYFIFINPFQQRISQIQYVIQEAVLFYVSIALAILSAEYDSGSTLEKVRPGFAKLIAYSHIGFIVFGYFILVARTFERVIRIIVKKKEGRMGSPKITTAVFSQQNVQNEQRFNQLKDEYSLSSPNFKKDFGNYSPSTYELDSPPLSQRLPELDRAKDSSPILENETQLTIEIQRTQLQGPKGSTLLGHVDESPTFKIGEYSPTKFPHNLVREAQQKARARRQHPRNSRVGSIAGKSDIDLSEEKWSN